MWKSTDDLFDKVRKMLPMYDADHVLNADQSGLEIEVRSNRMLDCRGKRKTLTTVRLINETTHSYTVQPTISLSGKVVGPIYSCLKETHGYMSDHIKSKFFNA